MLFLTVCFIPIDADAPPFGSSAIVFYVLLTFLKPVLLRISLKKGENVSRGGINR